MATYQIKSEKGTIARITSKPSTVYRTTSLGRGPRGLPGQDGITPETPNFTSEGDIEINGAYPDYSFRVINHMKVLNVRDFGATGDGATDDTSAIQHALDAAGGAGGIVYIPKGTYLLNAALELSGPTTINGEGVNSTILVQNDTAADGIMGTDAGPFVIEDLTIDGPGSGTGTGISMVRDLNSSTPQITLRNLLVRQFGLDGINIETAAVAVFDRVTCAENGGDGFSLSNQATATTFLSCLANSNLHAGFHMDQAKYSSLNSCHANANGIGYLIENSQGSALNACGAEATVVRDEDWDGTALKIDGCANITAQVYVTQNDDVAIRVVGNSQNVYLENCTDNSPTENATIFRQVEALSEVAILGGNQPTPDDFATGTTTILTDGLGHIILAEDPTEDMHAVTKQYVDNQAPIGEAYVDTEIAKLFTAANSTVTVGTGGDYATINEALIDLSRKRPLYENQGFTTTVKLLSGFVMEEQVLIKSVDLSWITITAEDAEVEIDPAAITIEFLDEDNITPVFGAKDNGKLPIIAALFAYPDQGDGYAAAPMDGVMVAFGSQALFKPGAGVNRARNGEKVLYSSTSICYMPGLTQGDAGVGAGTVTGVEFTYCTGVALHIGFGSKANMARSLLHHAKGSYGAYVIWGSHADLYQSQINDTTLGYAITCRDGSYANMRETTVARSVRGYHALHNARINARNHLNMWSTDGAQDCTGYGVLASANSHVDADEVDVSGSAVGVHASNSSSINFFEGIALGCSNKGVSSVQASTIDAAYVTADNSGTGFYAEKGSTVNAQNTTATNCTLMGYNGVDASTVNANGAVADGSPTGFNSAAGSRVNADTSSAQGCVDGYVAINEGHMNARNSNADGASNRGFWSERDSGINARGSSAQNCLIAFYAFEEGTLNAQSTNINGSGVGYHVDRDGRINAGASTGTATTGKSNIPINYTTGKGRISDAALPNFGVNFDVVTARPTFDNFDASTTAKGQIKLAGDLGGTADLPTVPGLAAKADDSAALHKAGSETITGNKKVAAANGAHALQVTRADGTTNVFDVDTTNSTPSFLFGVGTAGASFVNFNGKIYVGGGSGVATSFCDFAAASLAAASARIRSSSVDPSAPNDGELWYNGGLKFRKGSTTETIALVSDLTAKQDTSEKGVAGGYAELDGSGLVPTSQLPGYVDDVVTAANFAALPVSGETGKIYVTEDTNLTYRWSGSAYVEISASLALGATSSTAHRGDHGAAAYAHSLLTTGNPHNVTKSDLGLGSVDNTADTAKPVSTAQQTALDLKQNKTDAWTVISSGVQVAHTGNTTETTLATINIPANALGPNGMIRLTLNFSCTNNANAKTVRARLGGISGAQFLNSPLTSQARLHTPVFIYNRNATNSQIGGTNAGNQAGYGQSTSGQVTSAVDTTAATTIVVTGQLATGTDSVTLESYSLEYHYQA